MLLTPVVAQVQIDPTAMKSSAMQPGQQHVHARRRNSNYCAEMYAWFSSSDMYVYDAVTWEYSYLMTRENEVQMYFSVYETNCNNNNPTGGAHIAVQNVYNVKCDFTDQDQGSNNAKVTKTLTDPINDGLSVPFWQNTNITAECHLVYKSDGSRRSETHNFAVLTVSTPQVSKTPPPVTPNDPSYSYSDYQLDIRIDGACKNNCDSVYDGNIYYSGMYGYPEFVPPVKLLFSAKGFDQVTTQSYTEWHDSAAKTQTAQESPVKCTMSSIFGGVNRSQTFTVDRVNDPAGYHVDWSDTTVGISCFLLDPSTKKQMSWSQYTEFKSLKPNTANSANAILDSNRPPAGHVYVRAYVSMKINPWTWDEYAQKKFKQAVLDTIFYEPAFQGSQGTLCADAMCATGDPSKVKIVSYTEYGVYFQVEASDSLIVNLASGDVTENRAVYGIWTSTFVSCYFQKMLDQQGIMSPGDSIFIDTSQTFDITPKSWRDRFSALAAWAIVLIAVGGGCLVCLFVVFLAISGAIAVSLCVRKRAVEEDEQKLVEQTVELREQQETLEVDQAQLKKEQMILDQQQQQLDKDRKALDTRAAKAEALANQVDEMDKKRAALEAQIAGISSALGTASSGAATAQDFDEDQAVKDIEASHAKLMEEAEADMAASKDKMRKRLEARLQKKRSMLERARKQAERAAAHTDDPEAQRAAVLAAAEVKLQIATDKADVESDCIAALELKIASTAGSSSSAYEEELSQRKESLKGAEERALAAEEFVTMVATTENVASLEAVDDDALSQLQAELEATHSGSESHVEEFSQAQLERVNALLEAQKIKMAEGIASRRAEHQAAVANAQAKLGADAESAKELEAKRATMEAELKKLVGSTSILKAQADQEKKAVNRQRNDIAMRLKKRKERQRRLRQDRARLNAAS
jgi:hypothetical protein